MKRTVFQRSGDGEIPTPATIVGNADTNGGQGLKSPGKRGVGDARLERSRQIEAILTGAGENGIAENGVRECPGRNVPLIDERLTVVIGKANSHETRRIFTFPSISRGTKSVSTTPVLFMKAVTTWWPHQALEELLWVNPPIWVNRKCGWLAHRHRPNILVGLVVVGTAPRPWNGETARPQGGLRPFFQSTIASSGGLVQDRVADGEIILQRDRKEISYPRIKPLFQGNCGAELRRPRFIALLPEYSRNTHP